MEFMSKEWKYILTRIPVNTQHPAWGYKNAVACLNTNVLKDSAE